MKSKQTKFETKRLILRSIQLEDAPAIFGYRSDSEANKYQGWIPQSLDDVESFISEKTNPEINIPGSWHQLVLINKDDNSIIGDAGLHFVDEEGYEAEIGCTINSKFQKSGYATEALTTIINYLFNRLNKIRITASIDPLNSASIALVEKLGFKKVAHFKQSIFINGQWVDDLLYALGPKP